MRKLVNFRDDQHVFTTDLANIELNAQDTFKNVFTDAVDPGQKYAGLLVTQNGPTGITVAAGRYYSGGQIYYLDTPVNLSLTTGLPVVAQKIATVVVWGIQQQADIQPRAFITNADTGQFQPQQVAMETDFIIQLAIVYGIESASPTRGAIASGVIPIADITLSPSGVVSIAMDATTALGSVVDADEKIISLQAWQAGVATAINTLTTDMALLKKSIPADLSSAVAAITTQLTAIWHILNRPAAAVWTFVNRLVNLNDTDTAHANYAAIVEDGLRFPAGNSTVSGISLANPTDPAVVTIGNVTLPAFKSVLRHQFLPAPLKGTWVEVVIWLEQWNWWWWSWWWPHEIIQVQWQYIPPAIVSRLWMSNFPVVNSYAWKRRHLRRWVIRYGDWVSSGICRQPDGTVIDNLNAISVVTDQTSAAGLAEINRRPALRYYQCNRTGGEIYTVDWPGFWQLGSPVRLISRRRSGCWEDYYDHPYWDAVCETGHHTGSVMAHVFLNQTNGWMTHLQIFPYSIGPSGDLVITICEVDGRYAPNLNKVVSHQTVAVGDLKLGTIGTIIPITPCFLQGGIPYAIVISSSGNHSFWSAAAAQQAGSVYQESVLWYLNSDFHWIAPPGGSQTPMFFTIYMAEFDSTRKEVSVNPGQLAAGISALRITHASYAPPGTSISWEIQIAGVWTPLDADDIGALLSAPVVLPLRAVLTGTTDCMPALDFTQAELELSQIATSMKYFSKQRTVSPTTHITVLAYISGFDASHHTITAKLDVGAGFVSPSSTTDTINPTDPTKLSRLFSWTVASSTTFVYEIDGTTVSGYNYPRVTEIWDSSF